MKNIFILVFVSIGFIANAQDSTNSFGYNYRHGIRFYNQGVDRINQISGGAEKIEVDSVTKVADIDFDKALPFLEKAYLQNSKDKHILTALTGIYFSKGDTEKSNRFKKELDALKK